jgi:hypothetical protein
MEDGGCEGQGVCSGTLGFGGCNGFGFRIVAWDCCAAVQHMVAVLRPFQYIAPRGMLNEQSVQADLENAYCRSTMRFESCM